MHVEGVSLCPVCRNEAKSGSTQCPRCSTPHHVDCFAYTGRCAVFGCEPPPLTPVKSKSGGQRAAPLSSQFFRNAGGLMVLVLFVKALSWLTTSTSGTIRKDNYKRVGSPAPTSITQSAAPRIEGAAALSPASPSDPSKRARRLVANIAISRGTRIANLASAHVYGREERCQPWESGDGNLRSIVSLLGRIAADDIAAGTPLDDFNMMRSPGLGR